MRQILQNKPIYYHISTKSNEQILLYNKDYILFNNSGGGNCLYFAFLLGLQFLGKKYLDKLNEVLFTEFTEWKQVNCHSNHKIIEILKIYLINFIRKNSKKGIKAIDNIGKEQINRLETPKKWGDDYILRVLAYIFGVNVICQTDIHDPTPNWLGASYDGSIPDLYENNEPIKAFLCPVNMNSNIDTIWLLNQGPRIHFQTIIWK